MKKMQGMVAMITGASSGIGAAMAKECGRRGANVVLIARRKEQLDALCAEIGTLGVAAMAVQADVTADGDMERATALVIERFGRLDLVVANAGFGMIGNFERLTMADWKRQYETNVFGVLRTVYATLAPLKRSGGMIGVMGSVAGYLPSPSGSAYSSSKAMVKNFCESVRPELWAEGVSLTHLAPGFIATDSRRRDKKGELTKEDPAPRWLQMPVDKAARKMLNAVLSRRAERVVTAHGKITTTLARLFPKVVSLALRLTVGRRRPSSRQSPAAATENRQARSE